MFKPVPGFLLLFLSSYYECWPVPYESAVDVLPFPRLIVLFL